MRSALLLPPGLALLCQFACTSDRPPEGLDDCMAWIEQITNDYSSNDDCVVGIVDATGGSCTPFGDPRLGHCDLSDYFDCLTVHTRCISGQATVDLLACVPCCR